MNFNNPFRHYNDSVLCPDAPFPSVDAERPLQLLASCPVYKKLLFITDKLSQLKVSFLLRMSGAGWVSAVSKH